MENIKNRVTNYLHRLGQADNNRFITLYEEFIDLLCGFEESAYMLFLERAGAEFSPLLTQYQRRYLALKERETVAAVLGTKKKKNGSIRELLGQVFAKNSYDRVQDLANRVDFSINRRAVMVGCGAFPATLFWLYDHYPEGEYAGVDIDAECIDLAKEVVKFLGVGNIHLNRENGRDVDYSGVDFIFVANQVSPKKDVLERIAETADRNLPVVVRNPTRRGRLLAECVRENLPAGFKIEAEGIESREFLSADLFLSLHKHAP